MFQLWILSIFLLLGTLLTPGKCHKNVKPLDLLKPEALFGDSIKDEPLMDDYVFESADDSTTFPFIEAIVQRTMKQYMHFIRTQRNWMERILQSVREERVIRSRYNCSTDACIYKIQLFTHHLPKHLFEHKSNYQKRFTRSANKSNTFQMTTNRSGITHEPGVKQEDPKLLLFPERLLRRSKRSIDQVAPEVHDDALRLPDNTQSEDASVDSVQTSGQAIKQAEKNGPISHPITFGDNDKINMERVSQELLSEALSRESKMKNPKILLVPAEKHTSTEASEMLVTSTTEVSSTDSQSELPISRESTSFQPTTINSNTGPITSTVTSILEDATVSSSTESSDSDVPTTAHDDSQTTFTKPYFDNQQTENSEFTTSREENSKEDDIEDTIPFGMNKFVGNGYRNCTGRYVHYCLNALECVYISVLETAACYCRPGYTGVRCDMFNLPQTLDTLRTFEDQDWNYYSVHERSVETLYGVVEATARYTVNAVLEEQLLTGWNDVLP